MENKPQNVFDRLDSIEASQSATQAQNEQILDLLNKLSSQSVKQNVEVRPQPQVSNQELLREFVKKSRISSVKKWMQSMVRKYFSPWLYLPLCGMNLVVMNLLAVNF